MQFDELITNTRRLMAETEWRLHNCEDMYRLDTVLSILLAGVLSLKQDAHEAVQELEST